MSYLRATLLLCCLPLVACTSQLCAPGALSCRGNDVVACNADSATQTALESCAGSNTVAAELFQRALDIYSREEA